MWQKLFLSTLCLSSRILYTSEFRTKVTETNESDDLHRNTMWNCTCASMSWNHISSKALSWIVYVNNVYMFQSVPNEKELIQWTQLLMATTFLCMYFFEFLMLCFLIFTKCPLYYYLRSEFSSCLIFSSAIVSEC